MKNEFKFIEKTAKNHIKFTSPETLCFDSRIEIFSNRQFTLDGCKRVLQFNDDYIKLGVKGGNIIIYGNGLNIGGFEDENATVKGNISSVEFCLGGGKAEKSDL